MRGVARLVSVGYLLLALVLTALRMTGIVHFAAPFPLGPAPAPVVITVVHSTGLEEWLQAAAQDYAATSPRIRARPVQIELRGRGSRSAASAIGQGQLQPTVFIPASSSDLDLLRQTWAARNPNTSIIDTESRALARSPLVLIAWQERGELLFRSASDPLWEHLHAALTDQRGWAGLGGQPTWGPVKLGHTAPGSSSSGAQTLLLMAYAYYNKSSGLTLEDVQSPDFQRWFLEIERVAQTSTGDTARLMEDMLRFGPGQYDVITAYEHLALRNATRANQPLRVYYPSATTWSDFPYTLLQGSWVDAEQRAAARQFGDFLLEQAAQEQALSYGLRPARNSLPIDETNSPFGRASSIGVQLEPPAAVEAPAPDVLAALVELAQSRAQN